MSGYVSSRGLGRRGDWPDLGPEFAQDQLLADYRLMMLGLDCEAFHGWLRLLKHGQAAGLPPDPRKPNGATI